MKEEMRKKKEMAEQIQREEDEERQAEIDAEMEAKRKHDEAEYARWKSYHVTVVQKPQDQYKDQEEKDEKMA